MSNILKGKKLDTTVNEKKVKSEVYFAADGSVMDSISYPSHMMTRYINYDLQYFDNDNLHAQKKLPQLYTGREDCCGCGACSAICPRAAIDMKEDEEGFEYPIVDVSLCVRCYKCEFVCPIKKHKK